jgi:hypothetical protein
MKQLNRPLRLTLTLAATTLAACAFTSSSPFAGYVELPRERATVGLWDVGDQNCRGSIQRSVEGSFWVVDCRFRLGYGHCTHGLPLRDRGAGRYATSGGAIAFTILEDGRLEESKQGQVEGRYERLDGHICGARRAGEYPWDR